MSKFILNFPSSGGFLLIDELITLPEFSQHNFNLNEVIESVLADDLLRFSVRGSKVRLKPPELNVSGVRDERL
ncbi:unnamed protein product [Protopolystoma xenopodis]|uniref:Uncharacterized protein n=1 Tax=Protopolystoma xenopodis TaxID=117903 RepID=A0A448WKP5_9PLAT|nr:unnamed protein product [Protopolystoma xenopodis]